MQRFLGSLVALTSMCTLFIGVSFGCEDMEVIYNLLSINAYNINMDKAVFSQVNKYKVPIVYRKSTEPAQAHQQNNKAAKAQAVKNKSTLLPYIAGLIPCHGLGGKQGDKLRKFAKTCNGSLTTSAAQRQELHQLVAAVDTEDQLIKTALASNEYECAPVTKRKGNQTWVVTYTDMSRSKTKLVRSDRVNPKLIATVLLEKGKASVTADTDLVVVGNPKGKPLTVNYDPKYGFRTQLADEVRKGINSTWQELTNNENEPIQHGDESMFGLNPLDDVFRCYGVDGKIHEFDLTQGNNKRVKALKDYAKWLHEQSQFADIPIPTEELQMNRAEYLKNKFGIVLDKSKAWADYKIIREEMARLGTQPVNSPVEYTYQHDHHEEKVHHEEKHPKKNPYSCPDEPIPHDNDAKCLVSSDDPESDPSVAERKIASLLEAPRKSIDQTCSRFADSDQYKSKCLCKKLTYELTQMIDIPDSDLNKVMSNVALLDDESQHYLFKNLLQLDQQSARAVLKDIKSSRCVR